MAVRAFEARAVEPYEDGRAFGRAGPYEVVRGVVQHAVDPRTAAAQRVVDLEHAPVADDGTVRFDADVVVLRPVDATRGTRTLVYSVANRGMVAEPPDVDRRVRHAGRVGSHRARRRVPARARPHRGVVGVAVGRRLAGRGWSDWVHRRPAPATVVRCRGR